MQSLNAFDRITVNAFVLALADLDRPLPSDLQAQLNHIGQIYPDQVSTLHQLAQDYAPLWQHYQTQREHIQAQTAECLAGPLPSMDAPEEKGRLTDIQNLSTQIPQILQTEDPAQMARQVVYPPKGFLHRLWPHKR